MNRKNKKELKQFKLESKDDFVIYLQELITRTDKCIYHFGNHLKIFKEFIEVKKNENTDLSIEEILISSIDYNLYLSIMSGHIFYILNVIGDLSNGAISYYKFRDIIQKRINKKSLDFEIDELPKDIKDDLVLFNKSRNWYNHIPESLINAHIELIRAGELRGHTVNPIIVEYYDNYTLRYVEDLYLENMKIYSGARKIHQCMKRDYSKLIEENVSITRRYNSRPIDVNDLTIAKLSADINQ